MKKVAVFLLLTCCIKTGCCINPGWINYTTAYGILDMVSYGHYVWGTSYGGLVRIDRDNNTSTLFNAANSGLRSNPTEQIEVESNGTLWISYQAGIGIASFDGSTWNYYDSLPNGDVLGKVHKMKTDRWDRIWCKYDGSYGDSTGNLVIRQGIAVFDHLQWTVYTADTISGNYYCTSDFDIDTLGNLWFATGCGVMKFDGTTTTVYNDTNTAMTTNSSNAISVDKTNRVWVTLYQSGSSSANRISSFDGSTWTVYTDPVSLQAAAANNIYTDQANNKYFYRQTTGVYKYDNTSWSQLPPAAWAYSNVNALTVDSAGELWTGCYYQGNTLVRRYDGVNGYPISVAGYPLNDDYGQDVAVDASGNEWLLTDFKLYKYDGIQFSDMTPPGQHVSFQKMLIDHQGNIWLCQADNSASTPDIWKYDGNGWTPFPYQEIRDMAMDSTGNIWFVYATYGLLKYDGNVMSDIDLTLYAADFFSVTVDRNQRVWVGALQAVLMLDGSVWTDFNSSNSPLSPSDYLFQAKADDAGNVWIAVTAGCFRTDGTSWSLITDGWVKGGGLFNLFTDGQQQIWLATGETLLKYNGVSFDQYGINTTGIGINAVYDITQDHHGNFWMAGYCGPFSSWNEQGITDIGPDPQHAISGTVYLDRNLNGQRDSGEAALPYQRLTIVPDSTVRFTGPGGNYSFYADSGNYEIQLDPYTNWVITSDSMSYHPTMFAADLCCYDFGATTDGLFSHVDLNMTLAPLRCNSTQPVWFTVTNTGNDVADVILYFVPDTQAAMTGISAPPVSYTLGDTLYWILGQMSPFEIRQVVTQIRVPGIGTGFDTLGFHSGVFLSSSLQLMDTAVASGRITCPVDPNDKIVSPAGEQARHYTLMDTTLEYTIRFQNTGNDTAFQVIIRDRLDPSLDVNSLRYVASSHPCSMSCSSSGQLEFRIDHINLPFKDEDEINSNGFVIYCIKAKPHLPDLTVVSNSAAIYFDFNAAVLTDTTFNTLEYNIPDGVQPLHASNPCTFYPNPFQDNARLSFNNPDHSKYIFTLRDLTGRKVLEQTTDKNELLLERGMLSNGLYIWSLKKESGVLTYVGKAVIE